MNDETSIANTEAANLEQPADQEIEICGAPDTAPVLPKEVKSVEAVCRGIEIVTFRMFKQTKFIWTFEVLEPADFRNVELKMYARRSDGWKGGRPPKGAKLWKIVQVATGGVRKKGRLITSRDFVGKRFRCQLGHSKGAYPYSVITAITQVLT